MNNLTENEIKLLRKISNIIGFIALVILILSVILIVMGNLFLEPIFYFPAISASVFLFYIYKFNITLRLNNGTINYYKLKLILLSYVRSIFLSLTYLAVVVGKHFETSFFLILAIAALICEIILKKYDQE